VVSGSALSDYAGNGGTNPNANPGISCNGPIVLSRNGTSTATQPGVLRLNSIVDGLSNTMFVGEKIANPGKTCCVNNESWAGPGIDGDIIRGCRANGASWWGPAQDFNDPTVPDDENFRFGSAHSGGLNVALGDGSVRMVRYSIDPAVFMRLCHKSDGGSVNLD
jgi:prepilin-type processing-associated H-X9-DG protein